MNTGDIKAATEQVKNSKYTYNFGSITGLPKILQNTAQIHCVYLFLRSCNYIKPTMDKLWSNPTIPGNMMQLASTVSKSKFYIQIQ